MIKIVYLVPDVVKILENQRLEGITNSKKLIRCYDENENDFYIKCFYNYKDGILIFLVDTIYNQIL